MAIWELIRRKFLALIPSPLHRSLRWGMCWVPFRSRHRDGYRTWCSCPRKAASLPDAPSALIVPPSQQSVISATNKPFWLNLDSVNAAEGQGTAKWGFIPNVSSGLAWEIRFQNKTSRLRPPLLPHLLLLADRWPAVPAPRYVLRSIQGSQQVLFVVSVKD